MSRVLSLSFLDVGQGDATIILPPTGEGDAVVFDCGDGWVVTRQLATWGVKEVAAVIISHLDLDHLQGLADLLDAHAAGTLRIGVIYFPIDRELADDEEGAQRAKALADRVVEGDRDRSWQLRAVHRDARAVLEGEDWAIHVAAPAYAQTLVAQRQGSWTDANSYSAVLRVRMKDNLVVIGGDAPLASWVSIPHDEPANASVFRVPHHGGALNDHPAAVRDLYDALAPTTAVVSVGTNNPYDHPDPDWIEPAYDEGRRLLCTQVTGRCHLPFARGDDPSRRARIDALERERERALPAPAGDTSAHFAEPPWRHYTRRSDGRLETRRSVAQRPEVPCAGTISVRLDDDGGVRVDPASEHASLLARIDRWRQPLCRTHAAET